MSAFVEYCRILSMWQGKIRQAGYLYCKMKAPSDLEPPVGCFHGKPLVSWHLCVPWLDPWLRRHVPSHSWLGHFTDQMTVVHPVAMTALSPWTQPSWGSMLWNTDPITPLFFLFFMELWSSSSDSQHTNSHLTHAMVIWSYPLVMTNVAIEKNTPFLRTVNHLFLWPIYTMANC